MAKMKIYTVHINPGKKHPYESPVFVEESFNFAAFVFQWLWALYHRLWSAAIAVLVFNLLLTYVSLRFSLHPFSTLVCQVGFLFFFASLANDLWRDKLKRQGYITVDIVTSDNLVGAEQRFFERYFTQSRPVAYREPHSITSPA